MAQSNLRRRDKPSIKLLEIDRLKMAIGHAMELWAYEIVENVKGDLSEPSGNNPQSKTGHLASSFEIERDDTTATVQIRNTAPYAHVLEYGTSTRDAKPFLTSEVLNNKTALIAALKDVLTS